MFVVSLDDGNVFLEHYTTADVLDRSLSPVASLKHVRKTTMNLDLSPMFHGGFDVRR